MRLYEVRNGDGTVHVLVLAPSATRARKLAARHLRAEAEREGHAATYWDPAGLIVDVLTNWIEDEWVSEVRA